MRRPAAGPAPSTAALAAPAFPIAGPRARVRIRPSAAMPAVRAARCAIPMPADPRRAAVIRKRVTGNAPPTVGLAARVFLNAGPEIPLSFVHCSQVP
jgi:hypothetical protein